MHEDDRSEQAPAATPGRQPAPPAAASLAAAGTGQRADGTTPVPGGDEDGLTGDGSVDAALSRLAELESLPVREHVAVFDAVHAALQDRLADVED